jgi:hypothetical protein
MFKPIKTTGLCLLAAFMLGAVTVGSASGANPEFLHCMEGTAEVTGSSFWYTSKATCEALTPKVTKTEGKWLLGPFGTGEKLAFTGTSGKSKLNSSVEAIECKADSSAGEINGPSSVTNVQVTLTECTSKFGQCHSTTPAGGEGEIITTVLTGELIYLKAGGALPVGLLLKPSAGTTFTTISCLGGIVKETVTGSVIGEIPAEFINVMASKGNIVYKATGTTQQWTKVEEGSEKFELTAFGKPAAQEATEVTTFDGQVVIDAS